VATSRKGKTSPNDPPAHGALTDTRRALRQATQRGDKTFTYVIWAFLGLAALALLFLILSP